MRKFQFLILLQFIFWTNLTAQSLNLKGGFNYSNRRFDDSCPLVNTTYEYVGGINLGATFDVELNRDILFNTGIVLNSRGYNYKFEADSPDQLFCAYSKVDMRYHLQYLDIPFTLKMKHKIKRGVYAYGYAGAYVGFLFSGHIIDRFMNAESPNLQIKRYDYTVRNNIEPWLDYGINLGGGIEIKHVLVEISHSFGLRNAGYAETKGKTPNRLFSLSIGYCFEF